MKNKDKEQHYLNGQAMFIEEHNLKIGNKVRVLRKAVNYELGWPTVWSDKMDKQVGAELTIKQFEDMYGKTHGIRLNDDFWYPYFVLEKVIIPPVVMTLTSDYDATILEDGTVEVGCQTIPFEVLKSVFECANSRNQEFNS